MVNSKLKFLLNDTSLGRFFTPDERLDLPIFFVTEADLGKRLPKKDFMHVEKRYLEKESDFNDSRSLPETVSVPDSKQFDFNDERIAEKIKGLDNSEALQNPNLGIRPPDELNSSSDWLGLYYGFHSKYRSIFIRIDEIMREPLLCNSIGVASVVAHELGHAIMDSATHVTSAYELKFREKISPSVATLIYYLLEESLANLIACRCSNGLSPYETNVIEFMLSKQPFPYSLGAKLGMATSSHSYEVMREIQKYTVGWYKAKDGRQIQNISEWIRLILSKSAYTPDDLGSQIIALFGTNKSGRPIKTGNSKITVDNIEDSSTKQKSASTTGSIPESDASINESLKIPASSSKLIPKREGDKEGYVNENGAWVIYPSFESAFPFDDSGKARVILNKKYGWIDNNGTWIIRPTFTTADDFVDGLACVSVGRDRRYYGFINCDGEWVIDPIFTDASSFSEGLACVCYDSERYGYIDKGGEYVIKPTFWNAVGFDNGVAIVSEDLGAYYGLIDKSGKWIWGPIANIKCIYPFKPDGYARVIFNDDEPAWIDRKGKMVLKKPRL